MNKFLAYFLPHPKTHQKAHLLSWKFLIIYILLFILLRTSLDLTNIYKPGVLGINSNITVEKVIEGTNQERVKMGLKPLIENAMLDDAARRKAANMFEEDYWAHFAPSGKDPWGFITGAGYRFSYAGENLARNFYTSEDVVRAWMNSSSHKSNLLGSNYQEIGIAVVDGVLKGQKTTLVVQMFGTPIRPLAANSQIDLGGKKITLEPSELNPPQQIQIAGSAVKTPALIQPAPIDPWQVTKTVSIFFIGMISLLLLIDFLVLKRRGVFRLSSHHLAHFSFLAIAAAAVITQKAGEIL